MANFFTIDEAVKTVLDNLLSDLIAGAGKICKVFYPPIWENCNNCIGLVGGSPSNHYKTGGPVPFDAGSICPMCDGQNKRMKEVTTNVTLLCEWEDRVFENAGGTVVRKKRGYLRTRGHIVDLHTILNADYMVAQLPDTPYVSAKFKLRSQPGDDCNVIQGRYFTAHWDQID